MDDNNTPNRRSNSDTEVHKRQRGKNYAVLAALLFLVAVFFIITIVKMAPSAS